MTKNYKSLFKTLELKKQQLEKYYPLAQDLAQNLDEWFQVELTYTSNALEGNTLSRAETALVLTKGLTVGGKTMREHMEASNHALAWDWIKERAEAKSRKAPFWAEAKNILHIHAIILHGIDEQNAGRYRNVAVRLVGSEVVLPNPRKVPDLMQHFLHWLRTEKKLHPIELAAEAHYQLVSIHPFVDGNGRTARLLMNWILLANGYPPAIIRKEDRLKYLQALEKAQLGGAKDNYYELIAKAVERSLDIYLDAVAEKSQGALIAKKQSRLLKIGELAKKAQESVATIRYWTHEGLLEVAETTPSGYQLYDVAMLDRIEKIKEYKKQRYTLVEIKQKKLSM